MKDVKIKTLFIGGFSGTSKKSGRVFYTLSFAQPSTRDSCFGYDCKTCFVDMDTYNDFQRSCSAGCNYVMANILYVNGANVLLDYSFK